MFITIAITDNLFRAYVQLPNTVTPGDPEWNRIAREMGCDPDDIAWTGETALTEPNQTHTAEEEDDRQAALSADETLWRITGFRHD